MILGATSVVSTAAAQSEDSPGDHGARAASNAHREGNIRPGRALTNARGIVKSLSQTSFVTDLPAPVAHLNVREGQTFELGQVLVEFDCRRQHAELDALQASERESAVALESQTYLERHGATNRNDLAVARARVEKARAETRAMRARLEQCRLVAPFSGAVVDLAVNRFEVPQAGRPFLTVVGRDDLVIELIVPSRELPRLKLGTALVVVIDETGLDYPVEIIRLGQFVDAVSQTVEVFARFSGSHQHVLAGMSGVARYLTDED